MYLNLELYEVVDDSSIGYLALREKEGKLYLADLQVREEYRNMGYGTKLLVQVSEIARSKGYNSVYLKVFKNSPAINLYLRNGYRLVGEEQCVYLLSANT
jgi:ribosomal protein S18 acetylase RimI-like enzyme